MRKSNKHVLSGSWARPTSWIAVALLAAGGVALGAGCSNGKSSGATSTKQVCLSCAANRIVGVAAAGAPIAGGTLELVDSAGTRSSAAVAQEGSFSVDIENLEAPFLIEVAGFVGGNATVLHTLAVSADIGTNVVNVTPLTELLTAFVLGKDPREVFRAVQPDLSAVTIEKLATAEALVAQKLGPVLAAYGVQDVNIRTTEFSANGTGLDGALDALTLKPDETSGELRYQLAVVTDDGPMLVNPTQLDGIELNGINADVLAEIGTVLPEINDRLQSLATTFAAALPVKATLAEFFDTTSFHHNGLDFDGYATKVLLQPSFVGCKIGRAALEKLDDADHVQVSFAITFADQTLPARRESLRMVRASGKWQLLGNGRSARIAVSYLARIQEQALTKEEVLARADLTTTTLDDGRLCYVLKDLPAGVVSAGTMTCDNARTFGLLTWGGSLFSVDERAALVQASRYFGHSSARVRPFLVLTVSSSELDPRIDHVKVRGPGLPDAGLTLVAPRPSVPRDHLILEGDGWDWNAFDTERCNIFAKPEGCALDWSQVKAGSVYSFAFFDSAAAVNPFATEYTPLSGRPRPIAEWTADMDRLFPHFVLSPAQQFTLSNVFDPQGNFRDGGTPSVGWTLPADPTVVLQWVGISRELFQGNDFFGSNTIRKETKGVSLLGKNVSHYDCTFDSSSNGAYATWAWATLSAMDIYGNKIEHEVAPVNPY